MLCNVYTPIWGDGMTNRYVVQECEFRQYGRKVSGWYVLDRETGKRAKGTEPSQTQAQMARLRDELNRKDKRK